MSAPSKLLNLLSPVLVPLWNNSAMTEEAKRALSERLEALSDTGAPQHHPTPDDTESRGVAGMHSAPNATTPEPLTHLQKARLRSSITQGQEHILQRSELLTQQHKQHIPVPRIHNHNGRKAA